MVTKAKRTGSWVLPVRVGEELAEIAGCHPHTIQRAARGEVGLRETAKMRAALAVVADYFDLHPDLKPAGWSRPAHAPLPYAVASAVATECGVTTALVQKIASGIPVYVTELMQVAAAIAKALKAQPTAGEPTSAPREAASEAS